MDSSMGVYGAGLLVVLVVLFLLTWRGKGQAESVGEVIDQAGKAATMARELVAAAEQLWLTGRLQRNERLAFVLEQLRSYFPDLDVEQLIPLVEAGVYWLKVARGQLPEDLPSPFDRGEGAETEGGRLPAGGRLSIGGRHAGTGRA